MNIIQDIQQKITNAFNQTVICESDAVFRNVPQLTMNMKISISHCLSFPNYIQLGFLIEVTSGWQYGKRMKLVQFQMKL